jgi:BNR repeat-like domain
MRLRVLLGVVCVCLLAAAVVATVVSVSDGSSDPSSAPRAATEQEAEESGEAEEEEGERGGAAEVEEEAEETAERIEALQAAKAAGRFGQRIAATTSPAPGWVGSRVMNPATDDWEPAVATDPSAPNVYIITTRYGVRACEPHCPSPFIAMMISRDNGATWGPQRPICECLRSKAQYDPIIEVVRNAGHVYSVFLNWDRANGFSTVFTKSTNEGRTWTEPVRVYGQVAWTDKPVLTTNASGKHVYVSWNGPQVGDLYVGISHDYGATWTQQKLTSDKRYYYAYDGRVLSDGTVVFSESSIVYSGQTNVSGEVGHHAVISRDQGATWQNILVAQVPTAEPCVAEGCGPDFYAGQTSVVSDASGHLVFAYEGPTVSGGPQRVYISRSSNNGRTWSAGTPVSVAGEHATGPRLASSGGGNVRLWYMQTKGGDHDAWNVFYRTSSNGGGTWSSPVKISDHPGGAAGYVNGDGSFDEIYGDYGEIDITNSGKTVAVWGEGFSWTGPGNTWFNIQR